jgi:hypothetical protein
MKFLKNAKISKGLYFNVDSITVGMIITDIGYYSKIRLFRSFG